MDCDNTAAMLLATDVHDWSQIMSTSTERRVKCSVHSMNILDFLFQDDRACLHYRDKNWSILRHYATLDILSCPEAVSYQI